MAAIPTVALAGFLPAWDVERRRCDPKRLVAWALEEIRNERVSVTSLERLHEVAGARDAVRLAQHLTRRSTRPEARRAVHAMVRAALPELPWEHVAIQARPRFRILVPGDRASPLPLHTDFGGGRGLDERNVWIALTRARASAALRFASLVSSLERGCVPIDPEIPTHRVEAERGDVLLFTPLHVHGAQVAIGNQTRVSVDVRIAPVGRSAFVEVTE